MRSVPSANLGFLFDYAYDGPGIKVKGGARDKHPRKPTRRRGWSPGDVVLKINGTEVAPDEALYRDVLGGQTGRELTIDGAGQGREGPAR